MAKEQICKNVSYVGVSHYDRRLFDALIPTPEGTTYNSYLIQGSQKTALIDTVEPELKHLFLNNLKSASLSQLDYVISNHAEQDHSGCIPDILALYPDCKLVTNQKCKELLLTLMPQIPQDRIIVVKDRETLDLGGKTLEFILTPWIHWPETMMTWLQEDQILFPCDLFGSHLAVSDIFTNDLCLFYEPMKRYYAQIMMPYRIQVSKHLKTVKSLNPQIICPSHGPVFKNPAIAISLYEEWVDEPPKNKVLMPWVSTHGATARMAEHLTQLLTEAGIIVAPYDLTRADLGRVAGELVDSATIAIGTGCILTGAHPLAAYIALLVGALKPKAQFAALFGSYGWSGTKIPIQISSLLQGLSLEILPPVFAKGAGTSETIAELDNLSKSIIERHRSLNLF